MRPLQIAQCGTVAAATVADGRWRCPRLDKPIGNAHVTEALPGSCSRVWPKILALGRVRSRFQYVCQRRLCRKASKAITASAFGRSQRRSPPPWCGLVDRQTPRLPTHQVAQGLVIDFRIRQPVTGDNGRRQPLLTLQTPNGVSRTHSARSPVRSFQPSSPSLQSQDGREAAFGSRGWLCAADLQQIQCLLVARV
jgi:hypothetical protein